MDFDIYELPEKETYGSCPDLDRFHKPVFILMDLLEDADRGNKEVPA